MQYNGEMPFLTFITITGNPSIIYSSVFTLSIAFGSILSGDNVRNTS